MTPMTFEARNDNLLSSESLSPRRDRSPRRWLLFALVSACLILYLPGVRWGLPAVHSWSQDSIGGLRTLGAVAGWPADWQGRYPPLHYLILRGVYEPVLRHWQATGILSFDHETGQAVFQPPHHERIGLLLLVSGLVSVAMGVATIVGIWKTALVATRDELASFMAAASFMIGADFTYFSKLSNVDVPSVCWFVGSAYFYLRALSSGAWKDCALLGLLGSLAISTKDSLAGVYPGMAAVLLAAEFFRQRKNTTITRSFVKALLRPAWLVGLAFFIVPYLWVNGVFHDPDAYARRMSYWLDVNADTLHGRQMKYDNSLNLLRATLHHAASAVGWPMLAALIASCVYTAWRRRGLFLVLFVPCLSYYIIVIERMDFVYARFLFPMLLLLSITVGCAAASWFRRSSVSRTVRGIVAAVVIIPSATYAFAVNVEMLTDSRYKAEAWFVQQVKPPSSVGSSSRPQYLPRLAERGFATYSLPMTRTAFDQPQPEFILLTSFDYEDYSPEQVACMEELVTGRLGYKLVASFGGRFLPPHRSLMGLAGWGTPALGKVSPTLLIFQRNEN